MKKCRLGMVIIGMAIVIGMAVFGYTAKADEIETETGGIRYTVVAYDDSGSLYDEGEKTSWCYANFMMQNLAAAMNGQDRLYILYFSDPDRIYEVDLTDRQKAVDQIRDTVMQGGSPLSALEKGFEKLAAIHDSDPAAKYQMFILTDGDFYDDSNTVKVTKEETETLLKRLADQSMANGSRAEIYYLKFGANEDYVLPEVEEIHTYPREKGAVLDDRLGSLIQEVMDTMTGTMRMYEGDYKKEGSQIVFSIDQPTETLCVNIQGTDSSLISAVTQRGTLLEVSDPIHCRYAEKEGKQSEPSLSAKYYRIENFGNPMGQGEYILTFDGTLTDTDIQVLYEPTDRYPVKDAQEAETEKTEMEETEMVQEDGGTKTETESSGQETDSGMNQSESPLDTNDTETEDPAGETAEKEAEDSAEKLPFSTRTLVLLLAGVCGSILIIGIVFAVILGKKKKR